MVWLLPTTVEEIQELLRFAIDNNVVVIPYGGGTSVVGHLAVPKTCRPVLSLSLERFNRLVGLDRDSRLATFEAGIRGPQLEQQLNSRGFTLGHYPQSFDYSSLGGWVVTRSSGQQSRHYGRIEQLFAGGAVITPRGPLNLAAISCICRRSRPTPDFAWVGRKNGGVDQRCRQNCCFA